MSTTHNSFDEKKVGSTTTTPGDQILIAGDDIFPGNDDEFEVFKKNADGVDFRTVGWPRASVIFLKSMSFSPRVC